MTPTVEVEVGGSRESVSIEAILDTGFDGVICISTNTAVQLGLELVGKERVELADGSEREDLVFAGWVEFLGVRRVVKISLTSSEEALAGTQLLFDCRLTIDFPGEKVRVVRKSSSRGRNQ
jgi:clan AA aspartic protease